MTSKLVHENQLLSTSRIKNKHNSIMVLSQSPNSTSPIKYLLQNNIKFNQSREGDRGDEQIQLISKLLMSCKIFQDLQIKSQDSHLMKELSKGVVLIYCESPHIMEIKDNELYILLEGQGFQYIHNNTQSDHKKFKIYDNNEYLMLRKMCSNDYFLSLQEYNSRYHVNQKKYQFMVDQNTLLGKISDQTFQKIFYQRIIERQKNLVTFLKKVQIFTGLPNSFFLQFSNFLVCQQKKQGDKVLTLTRDQKSRFVYLIQEGQVQIRHFNDKARASIQPTTNYYIKQYSVQKLTKFDSFGMQKIDMLDSLIDKEVFCLTDCTLYKIQKRLLAIIITSFEIQFQSKNKIWSQININNQIKGQNYTTPEKQLLTRNVQRIRTTERKSRDLRLRLLAPNKKKDEQDLTKSHQRSKTKRQSMNDQKIQAGNTNRNLSPDQKRRMIKTQSGRFRTASIMKFINNFGGILQNKQDLKRNQIIFNDLSRQQQEKILNQIELTTLEEEQNNSPSFRFTNKNRFQGNKFSRTFSQAQKNYTTSKFIPKIQPKASQSMKQIRDKYKSDIIGVFLDKKIKNEIVKKAEKVMNLNRNLKMIEYKNLKRLFSLKDYKAINAISEYDKKSIAQDIVQRMINLKDNPLLLQIESQRRKVERQIKLSEKQTKSSQSSPKKYKKQDELIMIKNQD